eukprot:scaffold5108_cov172-Amphora_coffeaeformis.AAC.26
MEGCGSTAKNKIGQHGRCAIDREVVMQERCDDRIAKDLSRDLAQSIVTSQREEKIPRTLLMKLTM